MTLRAVHETLAHGRVLTAYERYALRFLHAWGRLAEDAELCHELRKLAAARMAARADVKSAGTTTRIPERHPLLVPTALATVWTGLLLVISRRKAVAQVLGFLVVENGVFVFGVLLSDFMPVMVEAGVLLDLLAAIFVMGIVMFHIQREFASLDTRHLTNLRD